MDITLSIITINYNGLKDTCELIDSLPLEDHSIEVIVVDNASKNDEASIIKERYPAVIVIRSHKNLGFAGGNNIGIKAAHGKYLFFINNDTILKPQASDISHLVSRLESNEEIGIVCPKIRFAWDDNPIQFAGYTPLSRFTMRNRSIGFGEKDHGQYDTAHPTPYAHGAAMLVKRSAIDLVGLMPECYFLYYEELDWSMMFTRTGYSIWYEPACTIYHKESQSTGQQSPLKAYYLTRNRLLFVKRNIQGLRKYITYTYLIFLVAPRDICKYLLHGQLNLVSATIKGIMNLIF
ncbi:glycosyltransferase family 2 protein [Prevotella sp. E15-22]|uniref:glycosyltransferase family 2 protein n=1 Tax=Prevotella sp. E15-22 TaxID=2937774 RepID=UPI0020552930|nr:glycosyltransferase family 2 protein [Prevotella sp. E15-22]UPS43568.1 glycosyltransferase family 2 protein [Prevotella sp. E15-22]